MSDNEIVWLDGPSDPTFVVIREKDDSHYFYWPYESTFPRLIKSNDVEPVKVRGRYILSRYHYNLLTVWCNPYRLPDSNGKAIVEFEYKFHTPVAIPDSDSNRHVTIERLTKRSILETFKKIPFIAFRSIFGLIIRNKRARYNKPRQYASLLMKEIGRPLKPYLFDADYIRNSIKEVMITGNYSDVHNLVQAIRSQSEGNQLSPEAVIKFFNF